ncbi:hypothetical protein TCDM_12443 [Trypanosoma cruzi Dm28c]|uniref:Uncharacterized protein n=1 Tax=Trypanosoma cruzi Dm28c TaxID=1416333 RepID=V5A8Q8_TRYCR|nr:hypothetical protein TCDM_12443 [Trypanosoma cruzi Dm28c]
MLFVLLRGRGRQIFVSLVRCLALPCRPPWCLSDDILDPSLPPRGRLGSECRLSADATLQSYVPYLPRVFSRVRVIDLDANNAIVPSDATPLHRCCCRCGVFISSDGSEMRFVSHLYAALTPTVGAESVQRNDGRLAATVSHRKGGPFVVQVGGDGCGSLLLLFYGGCSVVVCACFLCGCRFAVRAVCELCLPREVASLPRTQRRRCDDVCLFAAPLCISLLPFYSPLGVQICSPNSATLLLLLLARAREERWRWLYGACGSKDSGVHWRLFGESSWTACRTGKEPDGQYVTEEEAFNAVFCDFAARSCSDYGGTNNSVGMEEYMNPDLTTPNTTDVCTAMGQHPWSSSTRPRRQGADKQQCVQQRHTEQISFKQRESQGEQRDLF